MASNKNLNAKEEKFINLMITGKYTQRKAYREAFPHTVRWKDKTVDERASRLFNSSKAQTRYNELIERHKKKAIMTRDELLDGLKNAFYIASGLQPTTTVVKDLMSGEEVVELKKSVMKVDLKAVTSIAHQISKLEGWEIDKVEHSGKIDSDVQLHDKSNDELIKMARDSGMSEKEIIELLKR